MEGLIPMVLKAIKKSRSQRHYECLSPSSPSSTSLLGAAAAHSTYQRQSFFINNNNFMASAASSAAADHQRHRRRHTATESDLHRPHHLDLDHDHDIHHHRNDTGSYYNYGIGGNYSDPQIFDVVMYQQQQQQHPMTRKQLVRFNSHKFFSCVTGAAH